MPGLRTYLPRILAVILVLGIGVLTVYGIRGFLADKPAMTKTKIQTITLLKPPPPPPKIEQPPPQPEMKQEVKMPEPEMPKPLPDVPDEPPPSASLGMDAEGTGAGDGFGLVGRKGGRGLLNGAGDPAMYYASQLQRRIEDMLAENQNTRRKAYSIVAGIWVGPGGDIQRVELNGSTGDRQTDELLKAAIKQIQSLAVAPPPDMPQPIRLRIKSTL